MDSNISNGHFDWGFSVSNLDSSVISKSARRSYPLEFCVRRIDRSEWEHMGKNSDRRTVHLDSSNYPHLEVFNSRGGAGTQPPKGDFSSPVVILSDFMKKRDRDDRKMRKIPTQLESGGSVILNGLDTSNETPDEGYFSVSSKIGPSDKNRSPLDGRQNHRRKLKLSSEKVNKKKHRRLNPQMKISPSFLCKKVRKVGLERYPRKRSGSPQKKAELWKNIWTHRTTTTTVTKLPTEEHEPMNSRQITPEIAAPTLTPTNSKLARKSANVEEMAEFSVTEDEIVDIVDTSFPSASYRNLTPKRIKIKLENISPEDVSKSMDLGFPEAQRASPRDTSPILGRKITVDINKMQNQDAKEFESSNTRVKNRRRQLRKLRKQKSGNHVMGLRHKNKISYALSPAKEKRNFMNINSPSTKSKTPTAQKETGKKTEITMTIIHKENPQPTRHKMKKFRHICLKRMEDYSEIVITVESSKKKFYHSALMKQYNHLFPKTLNEMIKALEICSSDKTCKAVVISSVGPIFASGLDPISLLHWTSGQDESVDIVALMSRLVHNLIEFKKPLFAIVQGPATGFGATLLLHCDCVYASEKASFQWAFLGMGLPPFGCSSELLIKTVGFVKARSILFEGKVIPAKLAKDLGIVTEVFSHDSLKNHVLSATKLMLAAPKEAMLATKSLLRKSTSGQLHCCNLMECNSLKECLGSLDCQNHLQDFILKCLLSS